jgi:mono/diheme cytochrome c family protein
MPLLGLGFVLATAVAAGAGEGGASAIERGAYLAKAGDCLGCHTEDTPGAVPYAGGRALATPFGTFYGPNITPDPQAGIGRWTETDFLRAMRWGLRPDGATYYPAFPFPSYTKTRDDDLRDLWAYLRSLPPSNRASRPHDLRWPYSWRFTVRPWRWLYFTSGAWSPEPGSSPVVARGAYLVIALGHCGECHTPRNALGGPEKSRFLAGGVGPDGKKVPGLGPRRLAKLSDADLGDFLTTGILPNGDVTAAAMEEVVRNTTSQLTRGDLEAVIAYLRTVPAPAE